MKSLTLLFAILASATCFRGDTVPSTQAALALPFAVRLALVIPKLSDASLPVPTRQYLPEYPIVMREARIAGEARVGFTVEADGRITNLRIVASTEKSFADVTLKAAQAWRFFPGKNRDGYIARDVEYIAVFELP